MSEDVHHVFPGDHPLGGERHSKEAVAAWFERLERLMPGHRFEIHRVLVMGWPWNTWAAVRWTAHLEPVRGPAYDNEGMHWLQLRWGRLTAFHAFLDTQRVADACALMARAGVAEAAAEPIKDRAGGSLRASARP